MEFRITLDRPMQRRIPPSWDSEIIRDYLANFLVESEKFALDDLTQWLTTNMTDIKVNVSVILNRADVKRILRTDAEGAEGHLATDGRTMVFELLED